MLLAIGDLLVVGCAAVACLVRPTWLAVWVLVIASSLWLPLNNGHLEGPVLVRLNSRHGLTTADLIGYGGWILAALTSRRGLSARGSGSRWLPVSAAAAVFVCGMAVSYFVKT